MGKFSDNLQKRLRNKGKSIVEFSCRNCLNLFSFEYSKICLDKHDDIQFTPKPACPRCGATEELIFTDYGQEKIEDMLFSNKIKKCN